MIKYFIFDFDGTLVDSRDISLKVYNELAKIHRFKQITNEEFEKLKAMSIMERCRYLKFPFFKIPLYAGEFYNAYKKQLKNLSLFDGIMELLKKICESGYRIAVISSNSEENIREFFKRNNLGHIDQILCSSDILGKDKIMSRFLKDNGLKASEVLYVGDETRDILACKKSGVRIAWVSWGYDLLEAALREKPDFIVNQPSELLALGGLTG